MNPLRKCDISELDNTYRVIFMPQGLGDILFFLMYAAEYRKLIPEERLAVVVIKKHFSQLVEMFEGRVDALCCMDMEEEPFWRGRMTYFYDGIYNSAPQPYLLRAVRSAMGLRETARAYLPTLPRPADMDRREEALGMVKGSGILIAPDAVSCNVNVPDNTWMEIAKICEKNGFQVFFNSNDLMRFGNYPKVFLSMAETMNFLSDAGGFISFRSGLCDVAAAFTNAKSLIIYPNNKKRGEYPSILGYEIDPNGAYLRYCSLKNIFPRKPIAEVIYDEKKLIEIVSKEVETWLK